MMMLALAAAVGAGRLDAGPSITLTPSLPSPARLGTTVRWYADIRDAGANNFWYRFRVRERGGDFHTILDYGPKSYFDWTAIDHEGSYQIESSVLNRESGEISNVIANFEITAVVKSGDAPKISATAHPLVFLYSAPACDAGSRMRVRFGWKDGLEQHTPFKLCQPETSMNFLVAGVPAGSGFWARHVIEGSKGLDGPVMHVKTATAPASVRVPEHTLLQEPPTPLQSGVLLQSAILSPTIATDLYGNLLWYYDKDISYLTTALPGGSFLGLLEDSAHDTSEQIIREFDLAGNTLKETNAARVGDQLAAMGVHRITAFHHEVRKLPDGKYLVLGSTERILNDAQGAGAVDVLGDIILVLDPELQVVWAWDAFDHLDPGRGPTLGETCLLFAGCPPYHLAKDASDWLHGNALQLTPDGNILYCVRNQDWVIKIHYNNGLGNGDVLWRLGKDGDFRIVSNDPWPWFSHQHDAALQATADGLVMTLFDDGNTRQAADPAQTSRGQVLKIDESSMTATLALNVDFGLYAYALGSAQRLPNGDFHFDVGWIVADSIGGRNTSRSIEVDGLGNIVYGVAVSTPEYRTIRMRDLYTP